MPLKSCTSFGKSQLRSEVDRGISNKFRIKSGKFLFIDGVERKIYDWALAIPTKVNEVSYEETAGDTPEAARRKKRWRKELQDKYPGFVPGDYSVQRIFCALGSAGWYKPDEDSSTVWDPVAQQTISYKVWLNREENKLYKDIIPGLLSGWATKEGEDAVATMGIKFNLSQKRSKLFQIARLLGDWRANICSFFSA